MTLNELAIEQRAKIVSVDCEGALRDRLLDMGLTPRTEIMLRKIAPLGDPIEVMIRGYELTLRVADAKKIKVKEIG